LTLGIGVKEAIGTGEECGRLENQCLSLHREFKQRQGTILSLISQLKSQSDQSMGQEEAMLSNVFKILQVKHEQIFLPRHLE
jgi:hypothetical protein